MLYLEVDDSEALTGHADTTFGLHGDMRSYTGSTFVLGKRSNINGSSIQKRNMRSSAESEMSDKDDKITKIVWTKKLADHQDKDVKCNVILQDDTSAVKLLSNGR